MKINIKGTNLSVSPDISAYLAEKLKSVIKLVDQNDETVIFDIELGRTTRHHQTGDIFSAIDLVKDQLLDELRGAKGKRLRFIKKSGRQVKEWLRRFYRR